MNSTLNNLRESISDNVESVDKKSYSHNIISISLATIASVYGYKAANEAIEDFGLEDLGWEKQL